MDEMQNVAETGLEKAIEFFRRNVYNILLVVIIAIFLFKDIVKIEESGKTISEIIASSFLSFAMGTAINFIFAKKGILAGKNTPTYIETMVRYTKEIEKTDSHIEEMDAFCEKKNAQRIKNAQVKILRTERIKYEDFLNKTMEEICDTKEKRKCWLRAQHIKIQYLTADNLLSETDERYEKGKKDLTINEYERKQNVTDMVTKLLFALIFGYFGVSFVGNYENILWGAIQICMWLLMGIGKYIQNYTYITDVYKTKIHRKINLLIEFNTTKGRNQ